MKSPVITLAQLRRQGACESQQYMFESRFGDSVTVTFQKVRKYASRFSWGWAGCSLLKGKFRTQYLEAESAIWTEFNDAKATLTREYMKGVRQVKLGGRKWHADALHFRKSEAGLAEDRDAKLARQFVRLYRAQHAAKLAKRRAA